MTRFSARIDQIYDEMYYYESDDENYCGLTMMEVFDNFFEHFDCFNFIVAFEDKDKTGLFDRKPHYHLIFETDAKKDTMRRFLTKLGFSKDLAGIHTIKDDEEYEAAMKYTLKHQNVVFTDYNSDKLDEFIKNSRGYQVEIQKSKNVVSDILERVIKALQIAKPERDVIAKHIYLEYSIINASSKSWDDYYCMPNGLQLLRMIQYIESKICFSSYERWAYDNEKYIKPEHVKQRAINDFKARVHEEYFEE